MNNSVLNYLTLVIVICAGLLLITLYVIADLPVDIYAVAGIVLMVPSLVFFTIARIQLGNSFQITAKANKLVTNGIYKMIRHPIYFFGAVFILGMILLLHQFYFIIIWCGLIFLQIIRIRKEEKILEEKFGEEYINYKKNTWF